MTENTKSKRFKISDRVKRVSSLENNVTHGITQRLTNLGTVKEIRAEISSSSKTEEILEESLMIGVKWDNGTLSYLSPTSLQPA
jgi:hypothetical protein